jgi:hypothetical protein
VDLMPIETNSIKPSSTEAPAVDSAESAETEQQPPKSILLKIVQSDAISPPVTPAESKPPKDKPPKSEVPQGDLARGKPTKDEPASSEAPTKKPAKGEATKSDSKNKNWRFLFIAMTTLVVLTLGVGASRLIFQQKTEIFKPPSKILNLTTEQIDKVIESGVRLDNKVTLAYLRSKLSVTQFQSQDRKYTVFRLITPETCGKLGCLYIVKPDEEGMSIPLQLEDIGVGKEMFKPSPKFHCFNVVQRQNDEDRNFEICEQGY